MTPTPATPSTDAKPASAITDAPFLTKGRVTAALLAEIAYIIGARLIVSPEISWLNEELRWTALRAVSAIALLFILFFRTRTSARPRAIKTLDVALVLALLAVPFFTGDNRLPRDMAHVFALTSFVIGLREELFYRGILQTALRQRFGIVPVLLLSNVAFLFFHWGVQPFNPVNMAFLFLSGLTFGLLYHATGSLLLVAAAHALYDAVFCYTPLLKTPMPAAHALWMLTALSALIVLRIRQTKLTL